MQPGFLQPVLRLTLGSFLEYTPGSQNTSIFPLTLSGLVDLYTGKIVKNPRLQIYDSPPTIHNSTIQDSRSMDPGVHGFMEPWIHGSMYPCIHVSMNQGSDNLE